VHNGLQEDVPAPRHRKVAAPSGPDPSCRSLPDAPPPARVAFTAPSAGKGPRPREALPTDDVRVGQLRGIDKKIAALKAELNYATTSDRQHYVSGIMCLEEEKSKLARGAMRGGQGELSDSERAECRSSSTDDKEDEEDALTPPPSEKLRAMDSEDESTSGIPPLTADVGSSSSEVVHASTVICEQELRQHFHLPLHTAAQKFGICTTAFKKLCRRFGIAKWPHRQLRGIDKKIAALKAELNYTTGDREGCTRSLKALREEKMRISRSSGGVSTFAEKNLSEHAWDDASSSPSSSPILAAVDRCPNRVSGNDSLWHGGRCLTDNVASSAEAPSRCKHEAPAAEELECAAALSMLAQLAGMTQERDRTAAVAGLFGASARSEVTILGKRGLDSMQPQLNNAQDAELFLEQYNWDLEVCLYVFEL